MVSWKGELSEIKDSLLTIRRAAASMIDDIEGHMKEIHLEHVENMTIDEAAELLAVRLDAFATMLIRILITT